MKIAIVNNGLACGGIERASTSLANHWVRKGNEISVIALYQSIPFFSLEPSVDFNEPTFPYRGNKHIYTIRMMAWLRLQVKKIEPDAVLAFGESTNPYVLLALMRLGVPVFVSDRMHPKARLPKLTFWLKKRLYPRASAIVVQTQLAKSVISSYLLDANINVIPNPVNVIEPLPLKKLKRIVAIGRLEKVKGHEYLIRAFAKLESTEWQLSLVGDGSLLNSLKSLAVELGIGGRVIFHRYLKNFRRELSEASIFVIPSLKEGFPNALLEAMSVPLPCIVTDFLGSNNEIINSGVNGLIVPTKSVDSMAKAINDLINNPHERESLAMRAFQVREDYQFDKIANEWMRLIFSSTNHKIIHHSCSRKM
ncbi:glycosyltransferase [Akkermansiaceae bacterium]|nr:glycosyltransferase [Akkermansiaceae bacterium]